MLDQREVSTVSDDGQVWLERSEYWADKARSSEPKRLKRERRSHPLVLTGYGVSLKIEKGALVVKNGFTHYPQHQEQFRFFPGDLETPQRMILIGGSGSLSFAGLTWLAEQNVALVRIGSKGEIFTAIGGAGSPTDAEKLKWQIGVQTNLAQQLEFASEIIRQKLIASRDTMRDMFPCSPALEMAEQKIADGIARLDAKEFGSIRNVLAVEGSCAAAYFRTWAGFEFQWKGNQQDRIPPSWRIYDQRSSILTGKKAKSWKAAHPLNAMLNYAYAILEADTRINIISEGYDPRLGVLHGGKNSNDSSFVFDLMEPKRPVVDHAILEFVRGERFAAKDFVLRSDGVCRLSPQMAKVVAKEVHEALAGKQGTKPLVREFKRAQSA